MMKCRRGRNWDKKSHGQQEKVLEEYEIERGRERRRS